MKNVYKLVASFAAVLLIVTVSFTFADSLTDNVFVRDKIASFGYVGVIITAFIANLNVFVPVPPGVFAPVFQAAGLSLPFIALFVVIGALMADLLGYIIGYLSRDVVANRYPQVHAWLSHIATNHQRLLIPIIILFAAFMPLPNETILIPLGMLNYPIKKMILPITIGASIHHTMIVYGSGNIFTMFF